MVGHRGIEPRDTCVSGRPVDQLGRGQQMAEVPSPTASRRPALFGTEPAPGRFTPRGGRRWTRSTGPSDPHPLSDGDYHLVVSSPSEESGRLERHGATRASVSNGARHPGRFTLHERRAGTGAPRGTYRPARSCLSRLTTCPTRDSNSEPLPSGGSASTKLG
jgi:hypothetical protein